MRDTDLQMQAEVSMHPVTPCSSISMHGRLRFACLSTLLVRDLIPFADPGTDRFLVSVAHQA